MLRGVRAGDERLLAAGRSEEAAPRDLRLGDDAHVRARLVDAADRVRRRRDVGLRGVEHLPERLLRRRELRAEPLQARRQALLERRASRAAEPAAAAATTAEPT